MKIMTMDIPKQDLVRFFSILVLIKKRRVRDQSV